VTGLPRRTRPIAGRPVAWLEAGAGPPLVLVHGAGGSAELWPRQLDALADVARVFALDLPGHGPLGSRGRPTIAAYAEWLDGFLAAVVAEPAILVGHSMGGAVAQALALLRPGRLAGLVLIATGARLPVLPRLIELLRRDPRASESLLQELSFGAGAPAECGAIVARVLREAAPLVTLGDYLACDRFDVRERLAALRVPTLVISGAEDRLALPRYARFLVDTIAGARLVEIEGAGHFPQLERPEAVNAAIRTFLAEWCGAATGGRAGAGV
jgi:pimeloyl-ACP methyl ester carboxylesterase